jgi:hypothetical protein
MSEIKVRVVNDGRHVRTVVPRNDRGVFQSQVDVNHHAAARRVADVGVEALGLAPWGESLHQWVSKWIPSNTPVAETAAEAVALGRRVSRRVGSNNGRKAGWIDFVTPRGVGVNLKFASSAGHDEIIMATPCAATAAAQVAEAATAPLRILQVQAQMIDGVYTLDHANLKWVIIDPATRGFDGCLGTMLARKRARVGAPTKGEVLPDSWAAEYWGNGGANLYIRPKIRGLKPGKPGWSHGTIADLHAALAALV